MKDCVDRDIVKHDIVVFSEYSGGRLSIGIVVDVKPGSVSIVQLRVNYLELDNTNVLPRWNKARKTSSSLVFVVADPSSVLNQVVNIGPYGHPKQTIHMGEVVEYIIKNYA